MLASSSPSSRNATKPEHRKKLCLIPRYELIEPWRESGCGVNLQERKQEWREMLLQHVMYKQQQQQCLAMWLRWPPYCCQILLSSSSSDDGGAATAAKEDLVLSFSQ